MSLLRRAAIEGLIWGIGGKVLLVVANLATLMVTSRLLTAAQFGVFAAATIFTDLAWALATSTFGVALVRKVELSPQEKDAGLYAFLCLGLLLACSMTAVAWAAEAVLRAPGLREVIWALALFVPIKLMSGYGGALLQRELAMKYYQLTQNLPQILGGAGVTLASALGGLGVWSLVLGYATATIMEFLLLARRVRMLPESGIDLQTIRLMTRIGAPTATNRLLGFVAANADRAIVSTIMGAASLGLYTRAYSLMMTPVKLLGLALERVLLPVFSHMQTDEARIGGALQRVLCAQAVVFTPLGVGFALSTPTLVRIVLGEQWSGSVPLAQIFFAALFARLGYIASETASIASGRAWTAVIRQVFHAGALICLSGIGAFFGTSGVAVGAASALLLFYIVSLRQSVVAFSLSGRAIVISHACGLGLSGLAAIGAAIAGQAAPPLPKALSGMSLIEAGTYWLGLSLLLLLVPSRFSGNDFGELRRTLLSRVHTSLFRTQNRQ